MRIADALSFTWFLLNPVTSDNSLYRICHQPSALVNRPYSYPSFIRALLGRVAVKRQPSSSYSSTGVQPGSKMMKLESPAADRNKEPIWEVLKTKVLLPGYYNNNMVQQPGATTSSSSSSKTQVVKVLETAAGHGIHTQYFVNKWNNELNLSEYGLEWIPTDPDPLSVISIQAYLDELSEANRQYVHPPVQLTFIDDESDDFNINDHVGFREQSQLGMLLDHLDLIININMVHISPWPCTVSMLKMASMKLNSGGTLFLYGPYKVNGTYVESNQRFDESLRARDHRYGIRDLEQVIALAERFGLQFIEKIEMPANNLSVIFQKTTK